MPDFPSLAFEVEGWRLVERGRDLDWQLVVIETLRPIRRQLLVRLLCPDTNGS